MKLLGKQVQYFGMDITITMPFVATDADGRIVNYSDMPDKHSDWWGSGGMGRNVGMCDLEGQDWKETLVDYSHLFRIKK